MEEAARRTVNFLYERLVGGRSGQRACVLVRLFKTHPYGQLPEELQEVARRMLGGRTPPESTRCLVLLGTRGDEPAWNQRRQSQGHQCIPLPSPEVVRRAPMIASLLRQFGVRIEAVVDPGYVLDPATTRFNVFYVPDAIDSPIVPAQAEFVGPCGVQSVLGYGGLLPSGEMFAVILFSRVSCSRAAAENFQLLALSTKLALSPLEGAVFRAGPPSNGPESLASQVAALEELLTASEAALAEQSGLPEIR
jgi:hypothetical protein